jgi:VanZ family protein
MRKTVAWPLALVYGLLVVYASLYPFADWRIQGLAPWAFLTQAPPRYWTVFDVVTNLIGYMPLGGLLCLARLRTGDYRAPLGFVTASHGWAIAVAVGQTAALSLVLESLQGFLPVRVPSNLDLILNALGGGLGAAAAVLLDRSGALVRWDRVRARWFVSDARDSLVLLALWPFALLFPAAVPFGLGQVLERLEAQIAEWLEDTPFLDWLPVRDVELQPLVPAAEVLCVMLGMLIPCLLGYSIIGRGRKRGIFALGILAIGCGVSALSAALSYGPGHAWAWLSLPVQVGLVAATVLTLTMIRVPRNVCIGVLLLALMVHAAVLNQAPTSAYFAQTLQTWEQGRFIRFNGLAQWLGWLWPYAVVWVTLRQLAVRDRVVAAQPSHPGRRKTDRPVMNERSGF